MPQAIFKNQGRLRIRLRTGVDLTGATCKIKYQKPNQTKGEWEATIVDAAGGVIQYNITDSQTLDVAGAWKVKAYCAFPDGGVVSGQIASFKVVAQEY